MAMNSEPGAHLRHFLDLADVPPAALREMLENGRAMKQRRRQPAATRDRVLAGKKIAMIFEQPSMRTRMSFDVGIRELGGEPLMVTGREIELGEREAIADTARVLSRYVDAIMIRVLDHDMLRELAAHATVPVINGLTKRSHPCQVMADLLTYEERRGDIRGRTVAWSGDSNNVLASWMHAAQRFDFTLKVATPPELRPRADLLEWARASKADVRLTDDPFEAVRGASCVITDSWVSMGDKDAGRRHNLLKPYQVNARLMAAAERDAIFMHCLPAHRGEEVTDDVMDGPQSVVFDEAENRLHAQKGILAWVFGASCA
jgi:ornithine carbamoyltransferase